MSLRAGTDLSCGPEYSSLVAAVRRGLVTEAEVDTALTRLFRARFRLGMFDPPDHVPYAATPLSANEAPEHAALALESARRSIVLLKNDGALLPLRADAGPSPSSARTPKIRRALRQLQRHPVGGGDPARRDPARRRIGAGALRARQRRRARHPVAPGRAGAALRDLTGRYFANPRFEGDPAAVRRDSTVDFHWWTARPPPSLSFLLFLFFLCVTFTHRAPLSFLLSLSLFLLLLHKEIPWSFVISF